MKQKHYNILKEEMQRVIAKYPTSHKDYQEKGLSDERWRWDLLEASRILLLNEHNCHGRFEIVELPVYDYLNDDHIDTALRKITNTK